MIPRVVTKIYRISNNEGYFYFGLTTLSAEQCIRQHYNRSLIYPNLKLYKHLTREILKDQLVNFEFVEDITTTIEGDTPSSYEIRKRLDRYISLNIKDAKCLNCRYATGLVVPERVKCRCGVFYAKNNYRSHQGTFVHKAYNAENNISEGEDSN